MVKKKNLSYVWLRIGRGIDVWSKSRNIKIKSPSSVTRIPLNRVKLDYSGSGGKRSTAEIQFIPIAATGTSASIFPELQFPIPGERITSVNYVSNCELKSYPENRWNRTVLIPVHFRKNQLGYHIIVPSFLHKSCIYIFARSVIKFFKISVYTKINRSARQFYNFF